MATLTHTTPTLTRTTRAAAYTASARPSLAARFMRWCASQEQYRFGWVAGILAVHGCALTPITLFAIVLSGSNIALWVTAIIAMGSALVANLAAQPMKVTIPVFFASILVDLTIIVACLVHGFDIAGTYI